MANVIAKHNQSPRARQGLRQNVLDLNVTARLVLMGGPCAAARRDQAVYLEVWTPEEQLSAINQSNSVSESNEFTLR